MPELPINTILHGDCIEFMNSLPPKSIDLIFADPPYNLQLNGELWRPNHTKVDAVDDHWDQFDTIVEYDKFTCDWLRAAQRLLSNKGTIWVIGSYHNIYRVGSIMMDLGYWILNDIAWIKLNPTPHMKGVRFCNAHETILWAKASQDQEGYTFHYRNMKAGNEDKQMRSEWYIPVCQGYERMTIDGEKAHTTQKPEALLHRIIASSSNYNDIVFDPFCGSGTTAAVAKRLGRRYLSIDREQRYVEVARKRVEAVKQTVFGNDQPIHLVNGPKPKYPFINLVEQGILPPGAKLHLKSQNIYATVQEDGTLVYQQKKGSIHELASHIMGPPKRNGWMCWLYTDPADGIEKPIDNLRPSHFDE